MKTRLMALILIVFVGGMQASATTMAAARQMRMAQSAAVRGALLRQAAVPPQTPAAAPVAAGTIDVPVGTKIALNLSTQIMSKSTKPGVTVRAVVAFPVTVGNQVAIPAGTFVEGQLISARAAGAKAKKGTSGRALQIHFTKLIYANGYTVPLDAQESEALVTSTSDAEVALLQMPVAREHGPDGGAAFIEGQFPTPPPLPPLPNPGPNPAVIGVAVAGAFVLLMVGMIALAKHSAKNVDEVLYDAGWQFSMALTSPLKLDAAQVTDAARMAPTTP